MKDNLSRRHFRETACIGSTLASVADPLKNQEFREWQ